MKNKINTEIFINKAKLVHGDSYVYTSTNYVDSKTNITFECSIHGLMQIRANKHLAGAGCKECSLIERKKKVTFTQEQYINKAKLKHGNRFDYGPTIYVNGNEKVKIFCIKHGEFEIKATYHLRGFGGCSQCSKEISNKKVSLTQEQFLEKARKKHGTQYGYGKTKYINGKINIKIECKTHGIFEQNPQEHLQGSGCPRCANEKNASKKRLTNEEIINRFKTVHGNKYEYPNLNYKNVHKNINVLCPKHGEFQVKADLHIKGKECEGCINEKAKNDFIQRSNIKHNYKYSYSKVNYVNGNVKVEIICPEHGSFWQRPLNHLFGDNCKLCTIEKNTMNPQEFIDRCNIIHNFKYDYSPTKYINSLSKIKIICPIHGEFVQIAYSHIRGSGCSKCILTISKAEQQVNAFIKSLGLKTEMSLDTIIHPKHLDIFVKSHNIAIEYNGLHWHSEKFRDKNYHINKTLACEKLGIRLIHIFEDEWLYKEQIVKSRLLNLFNLTPNKIFARKCDIREISNKECSEFLDNNHIQGSINSTIRIGLFYENILVSVMTFNKPRLGISGKFDCYELVRFVNIMNVNIVGSASKLLKYFIKIYQPKEIISYADRRWSQGQLYQTLGFTEISINRPNYWYIINKKRKHRFGFRKDILVKQGFDINKTERQIMLERGIKRIYDCGTLTYKLFL